MQIRIFKKVDGGVVYFYGNPEKKLESETDEEFLDRLTIDDPDFDRDYPSLPGLDYFDADEEDLPVSDSSTGTYHEQIYIDGAASLENIAVDTNWENQLMPAWLVKLKHVKRLDEKIDVERGEEVPSTEQLITWLDQRNRVANWTELEAYTQALANLDEDVGNGDPDKPVVRSKLEAKILELGGE